MQYNIDEQFSNSYFLPLILYYPYILYNWHASIILEYISPINLINIYVYSAL